MILIIKIIHFNNSFTNSRITVLKVWKHLNFFNVFDIKKSLLLTKAAFI